MKNGNQDWNNDFPIEEEVEDHAGRTRRFLITCHEGPLGFTVRAQEQGAQGTGYEFAAYSETSAHKCPWPIEAQDVPRSCNASHHQVTSRIPHVA